MIKKEAISQCSKYLLEHGWFVNQTVSCWHGSFPKGLSKEILQCNQWKAIIGLPKKSFTIFKQNENRLRALLRNHTCQTYWGSYLPENSYAPWHQEYSRLKSIIDVERDSIILQYDALYDRSMELGRILGQMEWDRLHPNSGSATEPMFKEWGERIWKSIPKKKELYNAFGCKAVEYRLLRDLTFAEEELLVSEVSEGFYRQVQELCKAMVDENREFKCFRAHRRTLFQKRVKQLMELWCFKSTIVPGLLDNLLKEFDKSEGSVIKRVQELMEYVVPIFSNGRLNGAIEGIEI